MGMKQNNQLREQAVKRAKKFKEEQAKKIEANKTANAAADTVTPSINTVTDVTINPATERKLHPAGKPSAVHSSPPGTPPGAPGKDSKTSASPAKTSSSSMLVEKLSAKKALASMKKERHAPISPSPRNHTRRSKKKGAPAHRSSPPSSTSHNVVGNNAPDVFDPFISPRADTAHITGSPTSSPSRQTTSPTPATGFHQMSSASREPHTGTSSLMPTPDPKSKAPKSSFFDSFSGATTSFTFGSPLSPPAPQQDGWKLFLNLPPPSNISNTSSVKEATLVDDHQGRSIFDAIADRARPQDDGSDASSTHAPGEDRQETPQPSVVPCVEPASTLPCSSHDAVLKHCLSTPGDIIAAALGAWVRTEVHQLRCLEVENESHLEDVSVHANMALTVYRPAVWKAPATKQPPVQAYPTSDDTSSSAWNSNRIFFVDTCGNTHLVDFAQTLYNVDIEVDDGASDFDSIASPHKSDLRMLQPLSEDETTSSDVSSAALDSDDLAEFEQYSCAFTTKDNEMTECRPSPETYPTYSNDEHVIDPQLKFYTTERTMALGEEEMIVSKRTLPASEAAREVHEEHSIYKEEIMLPYTHADDQYSALCLEQKSTVIDHASVDIAYDLSPLQIETAQQIDPAHTDHLPSAASHSATSPTSAPTNTPETPGGTVKTSDPNPTTTTTTLSPAHTAPTPPFPSDHPSTLLRTLIGTQSLYTLLTHLPLLSPHTATKSAIAAAFLVLVNRERAHLGFHPLPASYTAEAVLASRIMPHTVWLGTVTLARFMERVRGGEEGEVEVEVEEVVRVFGEVSKEDWGVRGGCGRWV